MKQMKTTNVWLAMIVVVLLSTMAAYAQATSRMIQFSGLQTNLPPDTTQALTVQMWDDAAAGTLIVSEDQPAVSVDGGGRISFLFGSVLGGLNPDHFPSGASRFLDVIDPGTGTSVLAGGRIALNASAFALSPGPQGPPGQQGPAGEQGVPGPPGLVQSVVAGDSSVVVAGSPADRTVAVADGGITTAKLAARAVGSANIAPPLALTGTGPPVLTVNHSGTGYAISATGGGFFPGVLGIGGPLNGQGVLGEGGGPDGQGVRGHGRGTGAGVFGEGGFNSGTGVLGFGGLPNGYGVHGFGRGTGAGVFGFSSSGGGSSSGVFGESTSLNGTGVQGMANNGASAYGVWGRTTSGYAGFFSGRVRVTGFLEKSGGGFQIDHPLDPANKYLYHSFVESPDMKNLYDGVAVLDGNGEAVVKLPDWFEALNRDFRYHLTCIGGFAPVYIAQEVKGNQFVIAGGRAGLKVSWQVTGIRQDAWANKHRMQVEVEKAAEERGHYLSPEVFNAPEEKGIEWAHKPEAMKRMKEERQRMQTEARQGPAATKP